MPRSIKTASGGSTFVSTLSPRQGGTGAENSADALTALNGFKQSELGAPLGIARLNASGGIDASLLTGLSLNEACVDGPALIQVDTTHDYFLTTFDSFEDYEVVAAVGSVSRNKNVITYTANSVAGMGGFSVNGRRVNIAVTDGSTAVVATPSIIAPVSGATNMSTTQTLVASTFVMAVGTDTHASSDWEAATDVNFATVVFSSYDDLLNLTSWTVNAMQPLTKYYVRTRHKSSGGKLSDWSAVSNFTTKDTLPTVEQAKLLAGDPATSDYFGCAVAVSSDGNTALIGTYGKTGPYGSQQGAAYVFTRSGSTWTQQAKLLAGDPASGDYFGYGAALSSDGNTALVGAGSKIGTYSQQGAAYVFTRSGSTWTQQAKLLASDGGSADYFGRSVALSSDGNTAMVGASGKTGTSTNQGVVYVFTRSGSTWTQQAKLLASDPAFNDYFGWSVALSSDGNTAAISAYYKTGDTTGQGATYIFTRSGSVWTQQAKLLASDPASGDGFGYAVAVSSDGNTAMVGASGKAGTYTSQGAVYVFTRSGSTWTQQAKLLAGDPGNGDYFGCSVALSANGDIAAVGALGKAGTYTTQGAAYVFTRSGSTWTQQAKLLASDPASGDNFGNRVALSSNANIMMAAAFNKQITYGNQGAVYVFA